MESDGAVVWITGGGSGLGRAMALEYARRGARVAVSGRRADRLTETVETVNAAGGQGLALPGDVNEDADLDAAVRAIVERWGRLDTAIANAGYSVAGKIERLTRDDWRRQLELNVTSVAMTAHFAIPELKKTRGRLAMVGSVAAFTPFPRTGPYCASKAAVLALGRTLAAELAADGVSCTVLQPGFVESEIAQVDNAGRFDPERVDKRPAKLMWKADDAARAMVWAVEKRRVEYSFTGHGRLAAFVGRHLPGLIQLAASRSG